MQNLVRLIELCIKHDAILEIQSKTVKVIKYDGVWIPNKRPQLWVSCCVSDETALGEICERLERIPTQEQ
jgi:hypothetical protein